MADKLSGITKAVVEKYVRDTLNGMGALKGAPCTIKSITDITGGKKVTYEWKDNNDVSHTASMNVMNGAKGDDYVLTSADKTEIAQIVETEIPTVEANPQSTASADLTKLAIGDDVYSIPSGGAVIDDNTPSTTKVYSSEKVADIVSEKPSINDTTASVSSVYSSEKVVDLLSGKATIDDVTPSTSKVYSSDKTIRDILKAKPQAEETMEQVLRNNEMAYKPDTTNYILLYVDDALPSLSDTWTLVHSYNVPLNVAVPTNHLDYTANNGQKIRELLHTMEDAGCEIHSHSTDEDILTVNTTRAVAYARLKNSKELLMAEGYKVHGFCEPGGTGKQSYTDMGYDDLVRQFYLYSDTNIYPKGINQPRGSVSQSGVTISSLLGSIKKGQNARKFLFHAIGNDVTEAYLKEFIETAQAQGFVFTTEYEYYQKHAYAILDDRLMKIEKAISTYKTYDSALFRLGLGKPSYDETAYPYALYYNSGDRRIIASNVPLIKDLTAQYVTYKKADGTSFNYKKFKYAEGVWVQEASTSATSLNTSQNKNPSYSNYDVLDSDGGTVCAVADYYTY